MQNLLFGITLEKRIYLHIQNLVILHSIASEYSFTFKSTLFKNPARSDIIAKRLCKIRRISVLLNTYWQVCLIAHVPRPFPQKDSAI